MANMTDEEKEFWEKNGDLVPPEIEDEINGEDVLSLEELQNNEYEEDEEIEQEILENNYNPDPEDND